MIAEYIILGILFFLLYIVLCIGVYLILKEAYSDFDGFRYWLEYHMSIRTRNIILRVLTVLGPIVFIPMLLTIFVCVLIPLFKQTWKWFIDIDNKEL